MEIRASYRAAVTAVSVIGLAACEPPSPETGAPAAADIAAIHALLDRVEQTFASGDLDAAMTVFTDDAVIVAQGVPDVTGATAIRAMYAQMLSQVAVDARLSTAEVEVFGDLAYERGSYTMKLTDKASGQVVADVENRHVHILKRQPDGQWKTWRMIVNSAEPVPSAP